MYLSDIIQSWIANNNLSYHTQLFNFDDGLFSITCKCFDIVSPNTTLVVDNRDNTIALFLSNKWVKFSNPPPITITDPNSIVDFEDLMCSFCSVYGKWSLDEYIKESESDNTKQIG